MNLSIQNLKIFNISKQKVGLRTTKDCGLQTFADQFQSWSQPLEVKEGQDLAKTGPDFYVNCQTPIKFAILIGLICGLCRYIEVV